VPNHRDNGIGRLHDLSVFQPHHPEPAGAQGVGAELVRLGGATVFLRLRVEFNDEPRAQAAEVNDVGPNRVLPAKVNAQRVPANDRPHALLGLCRLLAQLAEKQVRVLAAHHAASA
jgi:hypothetical protein